MFIFFQIFAEAKLLDPDQWNFYMKNRSLRALWIYFQNCFIIFRSRMTSFSYISFGVKHPVAARHISLERVWNRMTQGRGTSDFSNYLHIIRGNSIIVLVGPMDRSMHGRIKWGMDRRDGPTTSIYKSILYQFLL